MKALENIVFSEKKLYKIVQFHEIAQFLQAKFSILQILENRPSVIFFLYFNKNLNRKKYLKIAALCGEKFSVLDNIMKTFFMTAYLVGVAERRISLGVAERWLWAGLPDRTRLV